ncbi:hypothetical protein AC579_4574 [Pseudocercospora musae]|uniref:Uncharacterized protein n=1 Tax=Pseudocercospora musae TaxID=113226 RepID=A0A139ITE3_9PEZI|nr:hypothetical protein AC579_4574 [Pseudocercospora musae]
MKSISTFALALATVAPLVSAGWIAVEPTAELDKRTTSGELYAAWSKLNMASKYKNFPINGYLYSGGAV